MNNLLTRYFNKPTTGHKVSNLFPTYVLPTGPRIAFIGEAPGREEEVTGEPFVGASGSLLCQVLSTLGLSRSSAFFGNICQVCPPNNDIEAFEPFGGEISTGIEQLLTDLERFRPNICVLLGNTALRRFKDDDKASVSYWRGSLFQVEKWAKVKCMATYHPAAVLRQFSWYPVFKLDLKRAVEEGMSPDLVLPQRELVTPCSYPGSLEDYLCFLERYADDVILNKRLLAIDIEGGVNSMSCLSMAHSANQAVLVPLVGMGGGSFWPDVSLETRVWKTLVRVLTNPSTPKVLQNSLYDNFVLCYSYGIPIRGIVDDTMVKHWEAYPELEKGLGFLCSIYTKEPNYKSDRTVNDIKTFWEYCCKDSAVTYEINSRLNTELDLSARSHYRFNLDMLNIVLYMELRGIRYNSVIAASRRQEIAKKRDSAQEKLNLLAGEDVNVSSTKKFQALLYKKLGLPVQTNRQTGRPTTNYEALLTLAKKTDHPIVHTAIEIRSLNTREHMLRIRADDDGRIRCGYNIVGTETGRVTCYTSPTGSGYNLQTIPEYDRDLFIADQDCYLFQCDLSGADGWTVAAHCYRLGDPTMLEDLKAGVKIAKVIALMFTNSPKVSQLPRNELKVLCDTITKTDPIYFGSKCCQHGTNYGMGKVLLSATIFTQSEGTVSISSRDAETLQNYYLLRYPGVRKWHTWVSQQLRENGYIVSASGHKRLFFGRRTDHETLKQALADEPQENTTYATNLAAHRLWFDKDNRLEGGTLQVEPIHQVHDALVGQFRIENTTWALGKIKSWFTNTLRIAGQDIVIPFEGRYGTSWGRLEHKIV